MKNLITDVGGIKIGQAEDARSKTGVSLIIPDAPAICAVSVMGGGPGTRESDALAPENLVQKADAIVLSGGSVYGLEAAGELTLIMGAAGRGFATGAPLPSPIIPAAILFDLNNGGDKDWSPSNPPPYRTLTKTAYDGLRDTFPLGAYGAGFGAKSGNAAGGIGSASACIDGINIGAYVAVNSLGSARDANGAFFASYLLRDEDGVPNTPPAPSPDALANSKLGGLAGAANTSIGVIATDATLTRAQAKRLALMAQDGLARAIRAIHTPFDGDTIFALATCTKPLADTRETEPLALTKLGAAGADCVSRAVMRSIYNTDSAS